jgi:hypothetical protein
LVLQETQIAKHNATKAVLTCCLHLMCVCRAKLVAPREFNPRYEADFAAGADYDPDRQRSSQRKLQRQLVKEKRGAMRELRRDATFMSAVSLLQLLQSVIKRLVCRTTEDCWLGCVRCYVVMSARPVGGL